MNFIINNPEQARKIVLGDEESPSQDVMFNTLLNEAYRVYMEENMDKFTSQEYSELINRTLIKDRAAGHAVGALAEFRTQRDPLNYVKKAVNKRMESKGKNIEYEGKKAKRGTREATQLAMKKESDILRQKMEAKNLKLQKAQSVLDAIMC
jgi:hypothetical protein